MGSCKGEKCATINSTDLVPELERANSYPGRTGCLESCGGLGCDCLYPSSGCLFYRVYAVPRSKDIFEISRCIQWKQEVKLEVTVETNGKTHHYVLAVIPNVPVFMHNFTLTMTSLAVPPLPTLNQKFITNGKEYAIWQPDRNPLLSCKSYSEAKHLKCDFSDDCKCGPAESKVRCDCTHPQVSKIFDDLSQKLPRQLGSTLFFKKSDSQIVARIRDTASTEFVITYQGKVSRAKQQVNKAVCSVENIVLKGCYRCTRGADAIISCSSPQPTLGEIKCDRDTFVVSCTPDGTRTQLRLMRNFARNHLN
ncbi:hypothetical protein RB195_024063 [Necator americanus]